MVVSYVSTDVRKELLYSQREREIRLTEVRGEIKTTEFNEFKCLDTTQTWNVLEKTAASAVCGSIPLNSENDARVLCLGEHQVQGGTPIETPRNFLCT